MHDFEEGEGGPPSSLHVFFAAAQLQGSSHCSMPRLIIFRFSLHTQIRTAFKSFDEIYKVGMFSAFFIFGSFGVFDFFPEPAEPDTAELDFETEPLESVLGGHGSLLGSSWHGLSRIPRG